MSLPPEPTLPPRHRTERRLLQAAIVLGALVPLSAGLLGVVQGAGMTEAGMTGTGMTDAAVADVSLDSHVRYLSGLLFGIGLLFWSAVPHIERKAGLVRALGLLVFLGGVARAAGLVSHGAPAAGMMFGLAMELAVTPLLVLWQGRVARLCRQG